MKRLLAFAALLCISAGAAQASGVPAQLRGKALTLNWIDQRVEKMISDGRERPLTQSSGIIVYVSAEGRYFSKFSRTTGRSSKNLNEVSSDNRGQLNWRAEGRTLVADQRFVKGARRLIVSFDDSYGSCTLRVLHGKEAGSANIEYITFGDKVHVVLQSIQTTSASCSMQAGNPFAS